MLIAMSLNIDDGAKQALGWKQLESDEALTATHIACSWFPG
jgi:hypothetical protein